MFFVKSEPVCDVLYDSCIITFCDKLCDSLIKHNTCTYLQWSTNKYYTSNKHNRSFHVYNTQYTSRMLAKILSANIVYV